MDLLWSCHRIREAFDPLRMKWKDIAVENFTNLAKVANDGKRNHICVVWQRNERCGNEVKRENAVAMLSKSGVIVLNVYSSSEKPKQ